jgi:hypothetical protein
MASFSQPYSSFDADPDKRDRQFELFVKWFLATDPEWATQVEKVWLWKDYPGRYCLGFQDCRAWPTDNGVRYWQDPSFALDQRAPRRKTNSGPRSISRSPIADSERVDCAGETSGEKSTA